MASTPLAYQELTHSPRVTRRSPVTAVSRRALTAERGPASAHPCAYLCGRQADQWSYDHADADELTCPADGLDTIAAYSLDLARYLPACNSCHGMVDHAKRRVTHCAAGHPYSLANSQRKVRPDGTRQRVCRECARERMRRRDALISDAHQALGLTWRTYIARHGVSVEVARRIISEAQ